MSIQPFHFKGQGFQPSVENVASILHDASKNNVQDKVHSAVLNADVQLWHGANKDLARAEVLNTDDAHSRYFSGESSVAIPTSNFL